MVWFQGGLLVIQTMWIILYSRSGLDVPVLIHFPPPSLTIQIIAVLLESERRYVTGLTLLDSHYQQPMRMLSSFQPEILSMQQLNTLFLNWSVSLKLF